MKKNRNTLAKIIEAQPEAGKTDFAELYGRRLSGLEGSCHVFLSLHSDILKINETDTQLCRALGIGGTDKDLSLKTFAESKMLLNLKLLEAIINRDGRALRSLADFVDKWTYLKTPEDAARWEILILKKQCEIKGTKMTIKAVADYLNRAYAKHFPTQTADGLASLRRLCKNLKFPIAPDSKGRPKK